MNFFDGIEFIRYGNLPDYTVTLNKLYFADYFGIQYNHTGSCRLQIDDGQEIMLKGGEGFFSAPGRAYSYGAPAGKSRHHCFICFAGERVNSFIRGKLFSPFDQRPVFQVHNPEKFYRSMLELQNLLRYPSGFRAARRVHLLEGLLLQINEEPANDGNINPFLRQNIDQLRRNIAAQPQKNWDFTAEAKKISVSYPHFRRIFRQITGFAPTRFLIECRLNTAAYLLLQTNMPINEIAHDCGYQDEYYFSRLFKQYRNCTATEYRKKLGH
ncbi:MAG: AraC family transcriptional regulator [Lentisphaerae bacterium]|nr:AraC family transcriptional regulator [Lentisphaerota bacterium]MBE6390508.1 AraC family transcriptional regulator [Lentisphaerota bacterium]